MSTSEQVIPTTYKDLEKENFATRIAIKLRLWLEKIKGSSVEELERKRLEREWAEVRDIRLSLDYKALCNKLNPIERGQEDGAKQYPPSGQEAYEQFHIDLITTANQEISQQAGRRMEVLRDRTRQMTPIDFGNTESDLKNILHDFSEVKVPYIIENTRAEVISQFSDFEISSREYQYFKSLHQRLSEAKPPVNPVLMGILFIFIIGLEAAPNIYFLRDALPYGTFAAGLLSLLIVLINSGGGYAIGTTLCKRLNYIDRFRKKRLLAALLIPVSLTGLIWLLSITTNARTLLEISTKGGTPDNSLLFSPTYWMNNPRSTAMFLAGILSILIGIAIGYLTTGDTYPGYWTKRRELRTYLKKYEKLIESIRQKILTAKKNADAALLQIVATVEKKFLRFSDLRAQYSALATRHLDEFNRARDIVQIVAHTYRTANIEHRGASVPPTYFRESIQLAHPSIALLDDVDQRYTELQDQLTEIKSLVVRYQSLMQDQFSNEIGKLETEIKKSQGIALDNINKAAPALNAHQVSTHDF